MPAPENHSGEASKLILGQIVRVMKTEHLHLCSKLKLESLVYVEKWITMSVLCLQRSSCDKRQCLTNVIVK